MYLLRKSKEMNYSLVNVYQNTKRYHYATRESHACLFHSKSKL